MRSKSRMWAYVPEKCEIHPYTPDDTIVFSEYIIFSEGDIIDYAKIKKAEAKKAEAKKAAIEKKLGKMSWTVETDNDGSVYLEGWCRIMQHHFVIRADGTATINGNTLDLRTFTNKRAGCNPGR